MVLEFFCVRCWTITLHRQGLYLSGTAWCELLRCTRCETVTDLGPFGDVEQFLLNHYGPAVVRSEIWPARAARR